MNDRKQKERLSVKKEIAGNLPTKNQMTFQKRRKILRKK